MRAGSKLITAVIAGLSLVACGSSGVTSSTGASSTPSTTTTVLVNAPVGFNAARTEFVLPHKLGLLPAPELALAKTDSAYATGLANPNDWVQFQIADPTAIVKAKQKPPMVDVLGYAGASASVHNQNQGELFSIKANAIAWNRMIASPHGPGSVSVLRSTRATVDASSLNALITVPMKPFTVPAGEKLVAASNLEIQAAPIGTLGINGSNQPAICVPTPGALVVNGKPVTPTGVPVMTAGPSTVFASLAPSSGSRPSGVYLYDKGVPSCANFS